MSTEESKKAIKDSSLITTVVEILKKEGPIAKEFVGNSVVLLIELVNLGEIPLLFCL